jgi:hypothetical protein
MDETTENITTAIDTDILHIGLQVQPRAMRDTEEREYWEFELSNEEVDLHRTVFKMAGGQIQDFNTDPIVTYGHPSFDSTDPDDIIGIGPVYMEGNKLIGRYYPETGETNSKAAKVVSKLQQGMIRSASIVAQIIKGTKGSRDAGENPNLLYFRDWSLLMWGIVMKGSNPKAKLRTAERVAALVSRMVPSEEIEDQPTIPPTHQETETRQRQLAILTETSIQRSRINAREHGLQIS